MALYLTEGVVKNAVNVPSLPREVLERFGPYLTLAERLGSLAGQMAAPGMSEVRIEFAGDLASAPQSPLTAQVLNGMLRHFLDTPVNEVSAPAIARERGISVREERTAEAHDYVGLLTVSVRSPSGEVATVAGTVFGKQEARVVRMNQFRLEALPEGEIILCVNDDSPGVVGNIGNVLGTAGVNIARIALSREAVGKGAFAFINVDSRPDAALLEKLRALPHVRSVRNIHL
jgi:D-3-phosphoglycerate dehydrogenase/(S)-sulfolactate dehydrogenase